jgi:enoyl-CoA hydratase
MPIRTEIETGVAEIIMNNPPVNALDVQGWFDLSFALKEAGANDAVRVVILRAEGKGFNAGVDIKELQGADGHDALLAVNRACYEAFGAVYDCEVPVIAAVHGYCLGGGIGLVGNADMIIASEDAYFGLPEVDRGALGAATHLSRLVPPHKLRAMVYTAANIKAAELQSYGSIHAIVSGEQLLGSAKKLAQQIAGKSSTVIRAAKQALNGIDPMDVKKSYRYEQGFTYALTLAGVADEARKAFVEKRDAKFGKK